MTLSRQNNASDHLIGKDRKHDHFYHFLLLFFMSTTGFAQTDSTQTDSNVQLLESYRTPLSDMAYDNNKQWRTAAAEDNPWRENKREAIIKPRIKAEFFPKLNYDNVDNLETRSFLQNKHELERPRTNIFKYTF